jgi:TusA-related sulfurtransferase
METKKANAGMKVSEVLGIWSADPKNRDNMPR